MSWFREGARALVGDLEGVVISCIFLGRLRRGWRAPREKVLIEELPLQGGEGREITTDGEEVIYYVGFFPVDREPSRFGYQIASSPHHVRIAGHARGFCGEKHGRGRHKAKE